MQHHQTHTRNNDSNAPYNHECPSDIGKLTMEALDQSYTTETGKDEESQRC